MWTITVGVFVLLITLWLMWRKKKLSVFKSLNIPGPPPSIFFGNYWDIKWKGPHRAQKEWIEKYGRVLGYYNGLRPVLLIADPDILKQIQLKDFQKFANRPDIFAVGSASRDFNQHQLTNLRDKRWKDIRSIITPTFTTSKLKTMTPIVSQAVDELIEAVDKEASKGKPFDIYRIYQNLTMDVIARTSLGVHSMAQKNSMDPFIRLARVIFALDITYLALLTFSFPEFMRVFSFLRRTVQSWKNRGKYPREELKEKTMAAIAARRSDPKNHRRDLLQLMLDAQRTSENLNDSELTAGENDDQVPNGVPTKKSSKTGTKLTDEEISQNANLFLLAGYETTSTALAFTTHLLAHYPEAQEKIREEIREYLQENETELNYDAVHKLQFLDKVLNESLRMYPPITYFVNRQPAEDTVYGNVLIPKNIAVQVPIYYLHHDPTLWEDPKKFDPERFSPENKANTHPMAFQPFGAGPRNCIGMRFALLEAKLALAKLLQKYKLSALPGTNLDSLDVSQTIVTMRPKQGVVIKVEKCS